MDINTKTSIWSERYKPQHVSDVILPVEISNQIQEFIKSGNMPNLGFWSPEPGLGKSSTANAIIHDLGCEALWINASLENGIDLLRSKIASFASQQTFSDSCNFKVVVMDECLDENEKIQLTDGVIALKDMQKGKIYNCKSLNLDTGEVEDDTCEIVSEKEADIYEVTLENGRTIRVTSNHPFIMKDYSVKSIDEGLSEGDDLVNL